MDKQITVPTCFYVAREPRMVFAFVKNSKAKTKGKYAMEMVWFAKP